LDAKEHLSHPPVVFNGQQARAVALGFGDAATEGVYSILACAIMPDHAHLVVGRDGRLSEQIRSHLKRAASKRLRAEGSHPFASLAKDGKPPPSPWSRGGWQVFLNSHAAIDRAIQYVQHNPIREGLRPQRWSFVRPFHAAW
jgi:REP element-mobilizing transposase RayT